MESNSGAAGSAQHQSASDALNAIASAKSGLADRLHAPWWYHPALGAALGAIVLSIGSSSMPAMLGAFVPIAACISMVWLANIYKRKTGIDLGGWSATSFKSGAGLLLIALVALYGVCVLSAIIFGRLQDQAWVAWVAAGMLVLGTIVIGRAYDNKLREYLRASAA